MAIALDFNKHNLLIQLRKFPELWGLTAADLEIMPGKGLTHDHMKLGDSGYLLRLPRKNQLGMEVAEYLLCQKQCYNAAAQSGHAPKCLGTIEPVGAFRNGGLIVQMIEGGKPELPRDWPAIGEALGALHSVERKHYAHVDLQISKTVYAGQMDLIRNVFWKDYELAPLSFQSRRLIQDELRSINRFLSRVEDDTVPITLIGGDSHPGNFIIDKNGKAWLVDLEFLGQDSAFIDLADAGLPITAWLEPDIRPCVNEDMRTRFYEGWGDSVSFDLAYERESHMEGAEKIVRMRTLMWLCHWVSSARAETAKIAPAETTANWDMMAKMFLNAPVLEDMFRRNNYPMRGQAFPQTLLLPDPPCW